MQYMGLLTPEQLRAVRYIECTRRRRAAQSELRTRMVLRLLIAAVMLYILAVTLARII